MIGCLALYPEQGTDMAEWLVNGMRMDSAELTVKQEQEGALTVMLPVKTKTVVWQAALELECAGIAAGYGFGETAWEASQIAHELLSRRIHADLSFT
ncbi:hypothetical protein [Virgibacillus senegalensis]|uniref:hypothetical protein n=1 Tax=Virgibacillus senegalensis TaxID=1499679 RepID=UPI00069E9AA7|nr:hypothetical protein [Virgibacillus senegalensis]